MLRFVARLLGASDKTHDSLGSPAWRPRNFRSEIIRADPETDPQYAALSGDVFEPNKCYFSVRIVEVRLAEIGSYLSTYLPMCSCFLRYQYGHSVRDVPYIVSYDEVRKKLSEAEEGGGKDKPAVPGGAQRIEFSNQYIVQDAPFLSGGVSMYTALCRISNTGPLRGMLDLVSDAAGTIGGPAAGLVARSGVDMAKRLGNVLGLDDVSTRFGMYDGNALRKSGYQIFAGALPGVSGELTVQNGIVKVRHDDTDVSTIDDADYLLVAYEYRKTQCEDVFTIDSRLPFNALWEEVKAALAGGSLVAADEPRKKLFEAIARSDDLIESDRLSMIVGYIEEIARWTRRLKEAGVLKGSTATESSASYLLRLSQESDAPRVLRDTLDASAASMMGNEDLPAATQTPLLSSEALSARSNRVRVALDGAEIDSDLLARVSTDLVIANLSSRIE
ncbi:hypothetical protein [Caballeronia sp. LZ035]|uniref:hypothetical protein n=1 Tax=Caballeronia sp. LZ035 TaxID=3038568 RepID=UPI002866FAEF|nr:hypothetical protein [Caballeronia sp. LZ035]MDR5760980.1 hypothetical protein [Caballeronia sp. LZ035]